MTSVTNSPSALNTMTFPLHGARLIEASAGTGKTFTIAGLYLRLLLGHGSDDSRHQMPLTVDKILVVTFTEAATAELKDRIRARIHQARLAFARQHSEDPVIKPLLEQVQDKAYAQQLLLNAERQMDEAAIYTIHGFCQRMLTQNAFESGSRFNNEFVTDESQLKAQVVADYWRRHFYPLGLELSTQVRDYWTTPQALLTEVAPYLTGSEVKFNISPLQGGLEAAHQEQLASIKALKSLWRESQDDLLDIIASSGVNKRSYTKKSLPNWFEQVCLWAADDNTGLRLPSNIERFDQQVLIDKTPKGEPPRHAVFVAIHEFLANSSSLKEPLLSHAVVECRAMLAKAKSERNWLSFDDLLTQLSAAVDLDEQGLLTERIRKLYPVAMIDEFQDTDPLQYSIFSRIYLPDNQCGLFMIGDPKQAIYAFRGADIFTYIRARNEVSDHYTLGTNWRSTAAMVSAVNGIFAHADKPFIYDQDIPFHPVDASPGADQKLWVCDGQPQAALNFWLYEDEEMQPVAKGDYLEQLADATAFQIQHILTSADNKKAWLAKGEKQQAIQAGNIAVLVRTGHEGKMVKKALAEQGIASVYLSNRDSVFASNMSFDVLRLLQAVLNPEDDRTLRACLASQLIAMSTLDLDELNRDENRWESLLNEFRDYRLLWQQRGVMPMIRAVMVKHHIAERLLHQQDGERQLTDLLHLAELLQQASMDVESDHALVRWMAETIYDIQQGLATGGDEQIQRLESESNLVQIVTIHKSKGLEYDLVFVPFACAYRAASEGRYHDQESGHTVVDLLKAPESIEQADQERIAEDLRLIYVALTRAVYGCYVGLTPIRNGRSSKDPTGVEKSAIGYLIQKGESKSASELSACIDELIKDQPVMAHVSLPSPPEFPYLAKQVEMPKLSAKQFAGKVERDWRISSYSGLVKQGSHGQQNASDFDLVKIDEDAAAKDLGHNLDEERTIFTFPKGARPGTFLHTLFEEVDFNLPASNEQTQAIIQDLLDREQYDAEWLPVLTQLVDNVLATPLAPTSIVLNQIPESQRLVEMEFLLPIKILSSAEFNPLAHQFDELSKQAGALGFMPLKGMLKGFIDLVFESNGKFYVLDWKSNFLGDTVEHYHGQALQDSMADHRYDLQYQIYALALHRFLKSRITDYDYNTHFGGVYYLFLRGMDGQGDHGVFFTQPQQAFIEQLDTLIDGEVNHA
ncbi:exodeoxyribonuclease V subunit beta [Vibrio sp. SCSIO 43136]|uniref:exodeoxyribonuclease V subunit beta n=1 Tax=Vibrio sp. SCSIO 43136 TaxID=2819101 RepID=UPI002074E23B|nr:exodeoxyribonuclease V subunit beta [Vibrio sp. SCSIO 43136]USD64720.1 exodeoxyribonuclease V subunit beta [Vibrio sp. SCSIO 43136]